MKAKEVRPCWMCGEDAAIEHAVKVLPGRKITVELTGAHVDRQGSQCGASGHGAVPRQSAGRRRR